MEIAATSCFSQGSTCFELSSSTRGWASEYKGRGRTSFGSIFPSINCMILETQLRPLSQSINYQHCSICHVSLAVKNWPRLQRAFMLSILDKPQDQTQDFCNSIFNSTVCPVSNAGGGGGSAAKWPIFWPGWGEGRFWLQTGGLDGGGVPVSTGGFFGQAGSTAAPPEVGGSDSNDRALGSWPPPSLPCSWHGVSGWSQGSLCAGWEDKGERI